MLQINKKTQKMVKYMFGDVEDLEISCPHIAKSITDYKDQQDTSSAYVYLQFDEFGSNIQIYICIYSNICQEALYMGTCMIETAGRTFTFDITGGIDRYTEFQASFPIDAKEQNIQQIRLIGYFMDSQQKTVFHEIPTTVRTDYAYSNIIEDVILVHPVSDHRLIEIGYNRSGDYLYMGEKLNGNILIPTMVFIKLNDTNREIDMEKLCLCNLEILGNDGKVNKINKENTSFGRLISQAEWKKIKNKSVYPIPPVTIPENYYILLLPIDWGIGFDEVKPNNSTSPYSNIKSPYIYHANIIYTYKEQNKSHNCLFTIRSVTEPAPYIPGQNTIEIKYLDIKYDCIDELAEVKIRRNNIEQNICLRDIQRGDRIYDKLKKESYVLKDIQSCSISSYIHIKMKNAHLKVSKSHPIMCREGWKEAYMLTENDYILSSDGIFHQVLEIVIEQKELAVCSIVLEGIHHRVFVNDIQVGDARQNDQILRKLDAILINEHIAQEVRAYINKKKSNIYQCR